MSPPDGPPVLRVPTPGAALRPDVIDLDTESTGLFASSYPIEFGWCDDGLVGTSFLVRPHPTWSRRDWSWEAQQVHGVTWEQAQDEGVDCAEAVERLVEATRGRTVLSDAKDLETRWTRRLFDAVGARMPFVYESHMPHVGQALIGTGPKETASARFAEAEEVADVAFPHVHRALPDAMGTAALRRFCMDPAYMHEVLRALLVTGMDARDGSRRTMTLALMGGWDGD